MEREFSVIVSYKMFTQRGTSSDVIENGLMFEIEKPGSYVLVEIEGEKFLVEYEPSEWSHEKLNAEFGIPQGVLDCLLAKE